MRLLLPVLILLTLVCSQQAIAQELSQGQLRNRLLTAVKRDFAIHVKASGLSSYIKGSRVPMTVIDQKFRDLVDKKLNQPISTLEAKLLVRHPNNIPMIKIVREMSYSFTEKICKDEEAEGNETDSARHFVAGFTLALLSGEKFAHQYLTAHEGWMLDRNLDEYTGYNFASGIMDLHNNVIGIIAARKFQKSYTVLNQTFEINNYSIATIKKLALRALKQARKENKLLAVYAKDGACSQVSQREKFRKRLALNSETSIY